MRTTLRRLAVATTLIASLAASAHAGVFMTFETRDGATTPQKGTVWIDGVNLKVDSGGALIVYRGDSDTLWIRQGQEPSYMEITRKDAEQLGGMMRQVQEQLKALPPDQRAMVEQMMAGQMQGMKMPSPEDTGPIQVVPTGKKETISGFATTSHDVRRGAKTISEAWVTPWPVAGVSATDFKGLTKLADLMKQLAGPWAAIMDSSMVQSYEGPGAFPGLPIRTVTGTSVHEVTALRREDVAATVFVMPPGLAKKSLADEMGGSMGMGMPGGF